MTTSAIYRIYTEDEPGYRDTIIQALQNHGFPYFTLISGVGYGPGQDEKPENTVIIDVATEYNPDKDKAIQDAAEDIRRNNEQQSIFVVRIPAFPKLVTSQEEENPKAWSISSKLAVRHLPDIVLDENGKPIPERATARGKIVASYGDWEKLLGNAGVVKGKIVRFGIVRVEAPQF
jgi:hypothetical protein